MYKDGVGDGDVLPVLDSKYTNYVRRQQLEKMAANGVAPFKKVTKSNSKKDKDKNKTDKSMKMIDKTDKGDKKKLARTRSAEAVNADRKGKSSRSIRSSSSTSSRADSAGTENYRPPVTPDYSSLIKFSQMFNSKESYALQQYEIFKAAHRAQYPENSRDHGYSEEESDDDEEEEDDEPLAAPPDPKMKGKDAKAGKDKGKDKDKDKKGKEKEKDKKAKEKEKEKKSKEKEDQKKKDKEKDKGKEKEKSKKPEPPKPANPPVPPLPNKNWGERSNQQLVSDDEEDEDDEGRTIATTSTNNTEASTLADEVNSDILRQELLQNIRAISSTFPDNDLSFNAAVEALTDTYRHRLSILGFEGRRESQTDAPNPEGQVEQSQVETRVEPNGQGARSNEVRSQPAPVLPEPIRTGPPDEAEEFLLTSKTPSGNSKSKSIDNWLENSNREINNNLNRMVMAIPESASDHQLHRGHGHDVADVDDIEIDANLNEHNAKSAGVRGLGKMPAALLKKVESSPTPAHPPKYVNITGGTKYQEVKRALEEKLKHKEEVEGSSPRPPPFSTCDDDSERELHLTLSNADAINYQLHAPYAQNPYGNPASSLGSYGLGNFGLVSHSSSPVPPAAAASMHEPETTSNVRSLFNRNSSASHKPPKPKKFGNKRLRSSRGQRTVSDTTDSNNDTVPDDQQVRYNLLPSIPPSTPILIRKRKQQLQELGSRVPGVLRRQNMDQWIAKVVWFFANGDEYGNRHEFRFRPGKDVHDFEGLCDTLTQRIGLPRGVRHIFTVHGQPIWSLSQLQHEHSYVVSSTRKFKFMDYGKPPESRSGLVDLSSPFEHSSAPLRQSSREASTLRRERSLNDIRHERQLQQYDHQMKLYNGHNNVGNLSHKSDPSKSIHLPGSRTTKQQNILPQRDRSPTPEVERLVNHAILQSSQYRTQLRPIERQVILVINGVNSKIHSQVLLNTRVSQEWDELVKDLGMAVKIPKQFEGVLKTASGKSILSYSQLRSELRTGNQTYYVYPLKRRFPAQQHRARERDRHREETLNNMKNLSLSDHVVKKNNSAIFDKSSSTRYADMRLPKNDGYVNNLLD